MSVILPTEPIPAISDLTACNILICGDYGMGKSGLCASTGYMILNPEAENKIRQYTCLPVTVKNWQDHKDFVKQISQRKPDVPGLCLDSLNVSYDHCLQWVMDNVTFQGTKLKHPSENPQLAYPRVTHEFITWLREVTMLGYHIVATCHVNITEIKSKNGSLYNRWVPAFTGSAATSTYAAVLKVFSIVGFMTLEEVEKPSTRFDVRLKKNVPDARADSTRIETEETRVIHFDQSPNYLCNNKFHGFPDKVVLTKRWQEDWTILQQAWGSEDDSQVEDEPVQTSGLQKQIGQVGGKK